MMDQVPNQRLFLIDTFGFIFRAYHARARSGVPPMRTSTGLSTEAVYIFNNMLRKLEKQYHPPYIAAVFESGEATHRVQEFAEYKANRAETPPDLLEQIPYVRRVLEAMQVPILEYRGFEADDVIGTLARKAEAAGYEVVIVSSDKDMLQLVSPRVSMLNPAKNDEWYDPEKVKAFMGVRPEQVADLLALVGDVVDNIPGAPGIGEKGAKDLLERFGSLDAMLERAGEVEKKAHRESLQNNIERIRMSKRLATIAEVPIEFSLDAVKAHAPDEVLLKAVYKELEFHSLLKELGPAEDTRERDYRVIQEPGELDAWLAAVPAGAPVAVAISKSAEGEFALDTIGLAWQPGEARAVTAENLPHLKPWLEDAGAPKIACDVKSALLMLDRMGVDARGFEHDVMLYAFLLDADPSGCALDEQAHRRLDLKLGASPEQHADITLEIWKQLAPAVESRGLRELYSTIELPLTGVLARMERTGVRIDPVELKRLSGLMEGEIERLTGEIHAMAGKPFNISSPQQLGRVLFEDLKLPAPVKYGKGKTISTAADVLDELAAEHEIVRKVLEYRQLTKLKGTYVDALPALIDPATGRLHTSFNQTGAATGRLSSSNPNLQNIPIRTALGREIRAAFVPRDGWKLLVADYSQIELRLLAHMSEDPLLTEAFRQGEDIHTRTASEVLGVPPLMVTPEARRDAKAVNFGIVYGISPFGLAAQLGISRGEAEKYIKNYFARYVGVRRWLDATIAEVRQSGVTRTLFGRERPIPDINSRNPNARGFAERTAVNSPLQGTAADLIKLAMIRIDAALAGEGRRSAMLLQVHDELVFECPPEEVGAVSRMVKKEMEGAYQLKVPLLVDVGVGDNWRDAK
ncbi:DNA polymerase I [Candidatus Sulfopaludibacter sp. SbA4]|nr:DNA polymerase I [Candidatus Sulfopaludibacter sp. SbA4]